MTKKKHSLDQLKEWAKPAANSLQLVKIARHASSPTNAYNLAYLKTGDSELARSCRFLFLLKYEYGREAFQGLLSSVSSISPRFTEGTGKKKGAFTMSKKTNTTVKDAAENTQALPLEKIRYHAIVTGNQAQVKCIQEFRNTFTHPVEAVYVFPLPDDASVTKCAMVIGGRTVLAKLKKRDEARKEYEKARDDGHHATLLEQERPNIFTMNVGGIEPGEKISVEVDYVLRVAWQEDGGRFRIPLVVPPQFIPGAPTGYQGGGWAPDTDEVPDASRITPHVAPEGVSYNAEISVLMNPGFKCRVTCPSHPFIIKEQTIDENVEVELKTGDIRTDRDFTLIYTSVSKVPETAVHHGKRKGESFVLASIIPPGDAKPVPADIVMVLDCSGSMDGSAIAGLRILSKKIVRKVMNLGHMVGIVPYNNHVLPTHPVSEANESMERFIDDLDATGGTMLGLALNEAKKMLNARPAGRDRVILLVTDGDTEHGRNWNGDGIRLIGVGIGTAVNDNRIVELTRRNNGVAEFVYPGEDYGVLAERLVGFLSGPVLRDVKVDCSGDVVGVSDVFKGRPATIGVRFKDKEGPITIRGKNPDNQEVTFKINVNGKPDCGFAHQVFARDFIRENQNEDAQVEASLKYGIICSKTAFVAVSEKKVPGQKPVRVEIPVNLPDGWDYEKVFGRMAANIQVAAGMGTPKGLVSYGASLHSISTHRLTGPRGAVGGGRDRFFDDTTITLGFPSGNLPKTKSGKVMRRVIRKIDAQPVNSTRFTLDAKEPADKLAAIITAYFEGRNDEAERSFEEFVKVFTAKDAAKLDPEKKAMAFYFAVRLAKVGLRLSDEVMTELSAKPASDPKADAWYRLAMREQGKPSTAKVPPGHDAEDFIYWKLGIGSRPVSGDWAAVR